MTSHLTIFQRAFARRLRAKGMSLRDIAKEIGCSHSDIDVMLRGQERAPKSDPWRGRLGHLGASEGEEILLVLTRICHWRQLPVQLGRSTSTLASKNISGVVISPASSKSTDVTPLIERGIKVLAFDRKLPIQTDSVRVDNKTSSRLATQHLLSSGASRIACVNGSPSTSTAQERLAGYVEAIETAGLVAEPELQFFADFRDEGGFQATVQILEMDNPPDAIFVANNRMTSFMVMNPNQKK